MPLKRASDSATRATGAIERFIERTLAPRLEELSGEIRGLRGEMQQLDKRMSENFTSLRNETIARIESLRTEMDTRFQAVNARIDGVGAQINARIDGIGAEVNARIDGLDKRIEGLDKRMDGFDRRLDDAFNVRERLIALETRLEAQTRSGS